MGRVAIENTSDLKTFQWSEMLILTTNKIHDKFYEYQGQIGSDQMGAENVKHLKTNNSKPI